MLSFFKCLVVEKDESVSRGYLSELQSIKSHLEDTEGRLMRGIQTPQSSSISGDVVDSAVHVAEQEVSEDLCNCFLYWSVVAMTVFGHISLCAVVT